jgi:hypothetical protein
MRPHSRGADRARALRKRCPRIAGGRREGRVSADTHGPRAAKKHAAEPQVWPITGLPCAMVLTLIRALLRDRLSCPCVATTRLRALRWASAPGGQDHTISPSAAARSSAKVETPLRAAASIASHPACRDDRETPLLSRRDARKSAADLPDGASARSCDRLARRAIRA